MKIFLQRAIDYLLLLSLIVFPFTISVSVISPDDPGHPIIAVNFSLADVLIGLILILWIFKVVYNKEWKEQKILPLPIIIFALAVLISFVNAGSLSEWTKESVQVVEYFVLFYLLLLNNLKTIKYDLILKVLYISVSIVLLMAFIQHSIIDADTYLVKGLFENRNLFGAYLCLSIPFIYIEFINSKKWPVKIWMALLLIVSSWVLVCGSAFLAIIVSLGIISWKLGKKIFVRYAVSILLVIIMYPFLFLTKNVTAMKDFFSIYEQGSISKNYYRRLTMLNVKDKNILFQQKIGNNDLQITTNKYFVTTLPKPKTGDSYKDIDNRKHIKNRYVEMQASLHMFSENMLLGVGAGNFQNNIGTYYNGLPKVNTAEPYQNNSYLIIGSTIGLLGLSSMIWIFLTLLKNLLFRKNEPKDKRETLFRLGLFGAVLSGAIVSFFIYIFSASLMVPLIILLYLSFNQIKPLNSDEL
jgi:O-antigen ligase